MVLDTKSAPLAAERYQDCNYLAIVFPQHRIHIPRYVIGRVKA